MSCSICDYLNSDEATPELIEAINGGKATERECRKLLTAVGLPLSSSMIGKHRNEHLEDFKVQTATEPKAEKHPPGWEPFSERTDAIGKAITRLPRPDATHRDLLIDSGFNPDNWQIAGPVNVRRWMRYDQEWLYYYKFDVVAGESPEVVEQHVDELVAHIRKKRSPVRKEIGGDDAWVFNVSDWQIGKREGTDGTPETIQRVLDSVDLAIDQVKSLRRLGHKMPTLLFAGLGDIGEGTCGFYPGQTFLIDRNRRDQGRINRELITTALDALTPLFDQTLVAVVGGNHGENRSPKGERYTNDADNDDCAYFEGVKEAFDRAGTSADRNITWAIMEDELSMAVEVGGVPIGLTHGHLFERAAGGTPQAKAKEWWKGQEFGFQEVRGTQILVSAHFHHFSSIVHGPRTHFQTPAMDPGSKWFRQTRGEDSPPGTLTFRVDSNLRLGWDNLSILTP